MISSRDILDRAIKLIDEYDSCGVGECPYCAIAEARTALDREHGTGLSLVLCLAYPYGGLAADLPLERVRDDILAKLDGADAPTTKKEVLALLCSI